MLPYQKKSSNKAHEIFKSLFKIHFQTVTRVETADLANIVSEFGKAIIAHGVEEEKGGMYSLLLMSISNQVRVPSVSWANFIAGSASLSPLAHGPYFLIYSMPTVNQLELPRRDYPLSEVARILVPFAENKDILNHLLDEMVKVSLITPESKLSFQEKLITYEEFLQDLRLQKSSEQLPVSCNTASFFKPEPREVEFLYEKENEFPEKSPKMGAYL